ncbi:MAG: ACT domain-containing protein [Lactobacillus equicursoris]|uniref:ACT domain-containing protein n=1 Tax=Lactobacillus equicursoris TaxID=420645 RepID=UPI00242B4422|nr:ACT domain-containing protein [Lactobacillus equicursoris]MDD6406990.1 ACT domain-containing protein [Lactobacillus equicursoris]
MRAILTTVGQDKTGIVAGVSGFLAEKEINILDLSQTILNGYFTMMMVVDVPDDADFTALSSELNDLGKKLGVEINIRNEKMYAAMHELSGGLE